MATQIEAKYPLIFDQRPGSKIPAAPTEVGAYNTTAGGTAASVPKPGFQRPARKSGPRIPPYSAAQQRKTGGIR